MHEPPSLDDYQARAPSPNRREGGLRLQNKSTRADSAEQPLITVVTVVFNGAVTLERAIKSVLDQTYANVEYIIIDGGSTDATLDIIRKYEDRIAYWVSEPDGGIFDAMNKGVALASGSYIALLNADDHYPPDALDRVARAVRQFPDVIYGDYIFVAEDVGLQGVFRATTDLTAGMTLCHPAMFVSRKAYAAHGLYSLKYRFSSDFDLALRLFLAGCKFEKIDEPLAYFASGGAAERNLIRASLEAIGIIGRRAGWHRTLRYILMFLRRAILRGINAIVGGLFGKRASLWVKRRYYSASLQRP